MVTDSKSGTLVHSSNRGRFALDDPTTGRDLTSGDRCELWIDGRWIAGIIEYGTSSGGYYFAGDGGGICALCAGMRVRLVKGGSSIG